MKKPDPINKNVWLLIDHLAKHIIDNQRISGNQINNWFNPLCHDFLNEALELCSLLERAFILTSDNKYELIL